MPKPEAGVEAAAAAPRCRPSSRLLASAALAAASVALLLSVAALLAATSATRGLGRGLEAEHDLLVTSRPDLCLDTPDPGPCTSTVPRRDHTYSQARNSILDLKRNGSRLSHFECVLFHICKTEDFSLKSTKV